MAGVNRPQRFDASLAGLEALRWRAPIHNGVTLAGSGHPVIERAELRGRAHIPHSQIPDLPFGPLGPARKTMSRNSVSLHRPRVS